MHSSMFVKSKEAMNQFNILLKTNLWLVGGHHTVTTDDDDAFTNGGMTCVADVSVLSDVL